MAWKNGLGTTTELFVHPEGATLATFDWRLSMANVTTDAPFSKFEGVDRVLMVLEGTLATNVDGTTHTLTSEDAAIEFRGEAVSSAKPLPPSASAVDLNLMLRRGKLRGRLLREVIEPRATWRTTPETRALLCRSSGVRVSDGTTSDVLGLNDLVVLDDPRTHPLHLACDGKAAIYVVEIGP